jgi:hypothetical protein
MAGLDGTLAIKQFDTSFDVGLGEVFSNLDPALSIHFETRSGHYSFWVDGMYLNLSSDPFSYSNSQAIVRFEYVITEFMVSYRPSGAQRTIFEPFLGGRYTNLYGRIIPSSPDSTGASRRQEWFDPLLGGRVMSNLTRKLHGVLRADIGGFGAGADLTWGVTAGLGYSLTESIVLTGAYRLLDVNYETGEGESRFKYDAQQSGGLFGVAFLF